MNKFDKIYEDVIQEHQIDEWLSHIPVVKTLLIVAVMKYITLTHPEVKPSSDKQYNRHVESLNEKWAKNIQSKLSKDFDYSPSEIANFLNRSLNLKKIQINGNDVDDIIKKIENYDTKKLSRLLNNVSGTELNKVRSFLTQNNQNTVKV